MKFWMTEARMRSKVIAMLRPLFAFPVENAVAQGAPDVCCVAGWVELKVASRPFEPSAVVDIDLRSSQRVWLRKWRTHGGRAFTLVRVCQTAVYADPQRNVPSVWYLHDGRWSAEHLGMVNEHLLHRSALKWWSGEPTSESLVEALCKSGL